MTVPMINAPTELSIGRAVLRMVEYRLSAQEKILTTKRLDREAYLERFARTDELRSLAVEMKEFIEKQERNT